jgi:hypothetical protein
MRLTQGDTIRFTGRFTVKVERDEGLVALLWAGKGLTGRLDRWHSNGYKVEPFAFKAQKNYVWVSATGKTRRSFASEADALEWQRVYKGEVQPPPEIE